MSTALMAVLVSSSHADIAYAFPGMSQAEKETNQAVQKSVDIGEYWRYEIDGYDWQLVAGLPPSGYVNKDLALIDSDGNPTSGSTDLSLSVNGLDVIPGANFIALYFTDYEVGSSSFTDPIVLKNKKVVFTLNYASTMTGDAASFVSVRGVAIKEPPVPTGSLSVADLVREGARPNLQWSIDRAGAALYTPSVNVENAVPEIAKPAVNCGPNKTNNGHGNNEDGVDVSNPGKSAEMWADKKGIIDQSGVIDDESTSGGAAPSKK